MSVAPPDTDLPEAPHRDPPAPDIGRDRDGGGGGGGGDGSTPPPAAAAPPVAPVDPWQRLADLIAGVGAGPGPQQPGESPIVAAPSGGGSKAGAVVLLLAAAGAGYWWYSKRGKGA